MNIHPLFWAVLGLGALTGLFKEIVMLFSIVLVHELGHTYMAYRFNWRIKKITLLPFGGMVEMDEYGNRPVHEEILVTINGPIQHVWLIAASFLLLNTPFWSQGDHQLFLFHNVTILLFNLLPILPLDGGRLLFSLLSLLYPFFKAHQLTYTFSLTFLSILSLISITIFPFHLNLYAVIMFLWLFHYLEWKQRHLIFIRFLLERMENTSQGKKRVLLLPPQTPVAQAIKNIQRQKYHFFTHSINGLQLEEKVILEAYFNKDKRMLPIGKLV